MELGKKASDSILSTVTLQITLCDLEFFRISQLNALKVLFPPVTYP